MPQNIHSGAVEDDLIRMGLGTTVAFDFSSYIEKRKDEKFETDSTHLFPIQRIIVFSRISRISFFVSKLAIWHHKDI